MGYCGMRGNARVRNSAGVAGCIVGGGIVVVIDFVG
jgi:hypothetical protein